ncbi:MAG TPA: hydroxysqualene dehydroxylase HpnE [Terriglobales bacterium]|nr:hydroxysqualene dehydroxylase HpnE [Terriglobales bacterium]
MTTSARTVAVVGGGLAGLSAACALADVGFRVSLLERRPYLGGRASSYEHPGTGEVVDNCQHVVLACCTNLLDFYRRTGVEQKIRWYDRLTFLEPGGRQTVLGPSWLPAPLHAVPSFLSAASLGLADKLAIGRAMLHFLSSVPPDSGEPFLGWLRRHGQTQRAIDRFWKVVLVSALNEDLDRMCVPYAAQVFRESFLKSAAAGQMGVPTAPLTELYAAGIAYLEARGGQVRLRSTAESFEPQADSVLLRSSVGDLRTDFAVLAVPFDVAARLLPAQPEAEPLRAQLGRFETSPITGIHLWFDREVTDLDHAVLLDRTIQWMFHKSRILERRAGEGNGSYLELVVSSSKSLVEKPRNEILELALAELKEFFPKAAEARLVKSTVIKEVHATYSALPGSDDYRPGAATVWPRVFLAGDWTATGWPATMEGAVRSGYRAAEEVARAAGQPARLLVPDLPPTGFMRLFG